MLSLILQEMAIFSLMSTVNPTFYFHSFAEYAVFISNNLWPVFWQFHKIVRKESLQVQQPTHKLNLFWSVNSQRHFQVRT